MIMPIAQAAGVIDDAPTFAQVLLNAYYFLLQLAFIIGILGAVVAGMLYFFANGDRRRIRAAKIISGALVIGFIILFGAWVILKTVSGLFE